MEVTVLLFHYREFLNARCDHQKLRREQWENWQYLTPEVNVIIYYNLCCMLVDVFAKQTTDMFLCFPAYETWHEVAHC